MPKETKYIEIKFYKLWKHVRVSRVHKERVKQILFSNFPNVFNRFASYQHWKNSRVFAGSHRNTSEKLTVEKLATPKKHKLAIVFHVFYLDVFKKMINLLLKNSNRDFYFFITCPKNLEADIESILKEKKAAYSILTVQNHGRDILPFLKILPLVFEKGFDIVLKIHTKRSNHLNKKEPWNNDLFEKLLNNNQQEKILKIFQHHNEVGMIGPAGHLLPMSLYYGGNATKVEQLCLKMGLKPEQFKGLIFVAGSMFYATKEVLLPVLNLGLSENDFETENSQLDNTLAHTIERVFGAGIVAADKMLVDTSSKPGKLSCEITLNHPYTI